MSTRITLLVVAVFAWSCSNGISPDDLDPKKNTLVMVRNVKSDMNDFYGLTDLISETEHHRLEQSNDYVLINPPPLLLDEIAAKAHSHQNGLACGRLELLLDQPTSSFSRLKPFYHGSIKLDSIADVIQNYSTSSDTISKSLLESIVAEGSRHHRSTTGVAFPQKLLTRFQDTLQPLQRTDITYNLIDHSDYFETDQKSVVVNIPGKSKPNELVIIGAHLDSINSSTGDQSKAPGADDDASGLTTLLEMARLIAEHQLEFERTIEFHAYAAEEVGLVGSKLIAYSYSQDQKKVVGMFQIDMNGYSADPDDQNIYLVTNDTSSNLRRSLKDLLNTYMSGGYTEEILEEGSSDHASWTSFNFPAVFPFEKPSSYNPNIHTPDDTVAKINNFPLHKRFIQLGLLFTSHYAGLVGEAATYQSQLETRFESFANDLYIALLPEDDRSRVYIATDSAIEHVEVCLNDTAASLNCASERINATKYKSSQERNFFKLDATMSLENQDRLAIFGYNKKDYLVSYRSIQVIAK